MKVKVDQVFRLAQTLSGAGKGVQDPAGADVIIPEVVQPIIQLGMPHRRILGLVTSSPEAHSYSNSAVTAVVGGAGTTSTQRFTFERGLWLLSGTIGQSQEVTAGTGVEGGAFLILDPAAGTGGVLLQLGPPRAIGNSQSVNIANQLFHFPEDGWALNTYAVDQGAGGTTRYVFQWNLVHIL